MLSPFARDVAHLLECYSDEQLSEAVPITLLMAARRSGVPEDHLAIFYRDLLSSSDPEGFLLECFTANG